MTGRPLTRAAACAVLVLGGTALAPLSPAAAACAPGAPDSEYERAEVVVEGTFADGPATPEGQLYRPATFDVARYVKGSGELRLSVDAGYYRFPDGTTAVGSEDVNPRAGEGWRLYGRMQDGRLQTGICEGSRRMASTYAAACPSDVPEDGLRDVPQSDVHEVAVDCAVHRGLVRGVGDGLFEPGRATTRGQAASALAVALESTGTALPSDPPDAFDDDETSPHEGAANQLAALGLVRGTGPRAFSPDAPVTRGQTAALLVRAQEGSSGEQLPPGGDRFTDDDDSLHEPAIEKAAEAGFMGGRGYRSFEPDGALPRRQLASVLVRWVDPRV